MSAPTVPRCWKCGVDGSLAGRFVKVAGPSGWKVTAWCTRHDGLLDPKRPWWPTRLFNLAELAQRESYLDANTSACRVCGVIGPVEAHHLAPREIFGARADDWPVVDVCRSCHEFWHERMGHGIGHHAPVVR